MHTPLSRRFESLIADFRLFQQSLGQLGVQLMAAAIGDDVADHFAAGQGQVADHVEQLVPHALVGKRSVLSIGPCGPKINRSCVVTRLPMPCDKHALGPLLAE